MNLKSFAALQAPVSAILFLVLFSVLAIYRYFAGDTTFFDDWHTCDIITYIMWGFAIVALLAFFKDFQGKKQRIAYAMIFFLMIAAVLREMGIQHWLASTDTTAIKMRFFTNPNNPLSEKIITAMLVLTVAAVVLYLIWQYAPRIWRGFWNKEPMYWSICTLCAFGVAGKFIDRLPSNYFKSTGQHLSDELTFYCKLFEEGSEATLPLIILVALVQFHQMRQNQQKLSKED